jgi:toxin FitB
MYLLDTNVVSELRKQKPHGAVLAFVNDAKASDLKISGVTVGEIQAGIELTRDQDPIKANEIETWLEQIIASGSVLTMDHMAFRCWARLMHHRSNDTIEDAMIAATAIVNDLTVVTRNVRDFKPFGVRTLNPFETKR